MENGRDYNVIAYITIPLLIALFFDLSPLPVKYMDNLSGANPAVGYQNNELQAVYLQTAASFFPWRGDLWEKAGSQYLAAGDLANAIQAFQKAGAVNQLSSQGRVELGDAFFKNVEIEEAVTTWQSALDESGPSNDLYSRLLHAYVIDENYLAALHVIGSWNGWERQSAGDIFETGLYQATRDPDQASGILTLAGSIDPDLRANLRIITTAINASNADDPLAYRLVLIGRALGSIDHWMLAKNAFTQATILSPNYAEGWAFLSEAQDQTGSDGQSALAKALSLKPNSTLIQAMQAIFWENHGEPDLALIYLHKIANEEPENGIWQVELGNALVKIGDLSSALTYYQQAVSIEPDNATYWRALAGFSIYYNVQPDEIGLAAARQAVALDPINPAGLDILGQYFLISKDLLSAERMFTRSLKSNPAFALAQYHLGLTYLEEGEKDAAYQALTLSASLADGQPLGEQARRILDQNFP